MTRINLILLIAVLILGVEISFSYGFDKGIYEDSSSAAKDVRNLNLLMDLTRAGKATLKASSVVSQDNEKEITARVETQHAAIYAYKEAEIPEFLASNFGRIFKMVASYFNLKVKDEKLAVWVMDFDSLQKMVSGNKACPGGYPATVAALYAPHFNYFFFTPQYMNDYYVTHELIHYFIDEYREEVMSALPQVIIQRNISALPLSDFIDKNEEEIVLALSQIIIRKNLASLALQGV